MAFENFWVTFLTKIIMSLQVEFLKSHLATLFTEYNDYRADF